MKEQNNKELAIGQREQKVPFRLETKEGSLVIMSLGTINCLPPYTNRDKHITYPIGFASVRCFFDIEKPNVFSKYRSEISDFGDRPIFSVTPVDYPELRVVGMSPSECWREIAELVAKRSGGTRAVKNIDGGDMFGLTYVNPVLQDMLLAEYKKFLRPAGLANPAWLQKQKQQKRKRKANPKFGVMDLPIKRRKRTDSDSDFDENDPARQGNELARANQGAEDLPNLYGIFSVLCDFLSKKKRVY